MFSEEMAGWQGAGGLIPIKDILDSFGRPIIILSGFR
jgi:hypothetical protein